MKTILNKQAQCCFSFFLFIFLSIPVVINAQESMRANLYMVAINGQSLVDGNLTNYNNIYSNNVDINDGWKLTNPGINFGILRSSVNLVVERRSIYNTSDTSFFRMWNMPQGNFRIKFMLKNLNHPGMQGVVKDNYLNTETVIGLNDTTYYNFTVDSNPASAQEMRFQLIYRPAALMALDINFQNIYLQRKDADILVQWKVTDESSTSSYIVEHSFNGRNFIPLTEIFINNNNLAGIYNYTDKVVLKGTHFYRIKALGTDGKITYSTIAKNYVEDKITDINIYPNPVVNKTVQLSFKDLPLGRYSVNLYYINGTSQQLRDVLLNETNGKMMIKLPQSIPAGQYSLQFIGPDNARVEKQLQVL